MRKFLIAVAACLTMLLCSCGHNAITYGDGVGFDFWRESGKIHDVHESAVWKNSLCCGSGQYRN